MPTVFLRLDNSTVCRPTEAGRYVVTPRCVHSAMRSQYVGAAFRRPGPAEAGHYVMPDETLGSTRLKAGQDVLTPTERGRRPDPDWRTLCSPEGMGFRGGGICMC
jgi:hypothetical protein